MSPRRHCQPCVSSGKPIIPLREQPNALASHVAVAMRHCTSFLPRFSQRPGPPEPRRPSVSCGSIIGRASRRPVSLCSRPDSSASTPAAPQVRAMLYVRLEWKIFSRGSNSAQNSPSRDGGLLLRVCDVRAISFMCLRTWPISEYQTFPGDKADSTKRIERPAGVIRTKGLPAVVH